MGANGVAAGGIDLQFGEIANRNRAFLDLAQMDDQIAQLLLGVGDGDAGLSRR